MSLAAGIRNSLLVGLLVILLSWTPPAVADAASHDGGNTPADDVSNDRASAHASQGRYVIRAEAVRSKGV